MKEKAFSLHNGLATKRNGLQQGMLSFQLAKIGLLVLLYYPMSVGLTFYQKWFIKSYKFPLLVVCLHYMIKFSAAALLRKCHRLVKGRDRVILPWNDCLRCIAPIGIAASIDIGLSNWALEYITVSLYTMSKSTSIVFILVFAVLLALEKLRVSLLSVVLLISTGLFLFTYQSQQFDLTGFLLVELAALCGGLRWAVSQFVMQRDELGLHNPVDMIFHVQPWMIACIIPLVLVFEGDSLWTDAILTYDHQYAPLQILTLIFCGGMIAFFMEVAEYLLLVNTSGLTLNVFGILKEIITLALAHRFNGDRFSMINLVGLAFCLAGILLHVGLKWSSRSTDVCDKEKTTTKALLIEGQDPSDSDGER